MDISPHNITTLFEQLGLPATADDIDRFFSLHTLRHDMRLVEADFWSTAQASFLIEALDADADWAEIVDQLDARLRH